MTITDPLNERSSKKTRVTLPFLWRQVDMNMSVRIRYSVGEGEEIEKKGKEMEVEKKDIHPVCDAS